MCIYISAIISNVGLLMPVRMEVASITETFVYGTKNDRHG